jgi:hypothetical protein
MNNATKKLGAATQGVVTEVNLAGAFVVLDSLTAASADVIHGTFFPLALLTTLGCVQKAAKISEDIAFLIGYATLNKAKKEAVLGSNSYGLGDNKALYVMNHFVKPIVDLVGSTSGSVGAWIVGLSLFFVMPGPIEALACYLFFVGFSIRATVDFGTAMQKFQKEDRDSKKAGKSALFNSALNATLATSVLFGLVLKVPLLALLPVAAPVIGIIALFVGAAAATCLAAKVLYNNRKVIKNYFLLRTVRSDSLMIKIVRFALQAMLAPVHLVIYPLISTVGAVFNAMRIIPQVRKEAARLVSKSSTLAATKQLSLDLGMSNCGDKESDLLLSAGTQNSEKNNVQEKNDYLNCTYVLQSGATNFSLK